MGFQCPTPLVRWISHQLNLMLALWAGLPAGSELEILMGKHDHSCCVAGDCDSLPLTREKLIVLEGAIRRIADDKVDTLFKICNDLILNT